MCIPTHAHHPPRQSPFFRSNWKFFPVSLACCLSPIPSRFQRKPFFSVISANSTPSCCCWRGNRRQSGFGFFDPRNFVCGWVERRKDEKGTKRWRLLQLQLALLLLDSVVPSRFHWWRWIEFFFQLFFRTHQTAKTVGRRMNDSLSFIPLHNRIESNELRRNLMKT